MRVHRWGKQELSEKLRKPWGNTENTEGISEFVRACVLISDDDNSKDLPDSHDGVVFAGAFPTPAVAAPFGSLTRFHNILL